MYSGPIFCRGCEHLKTYCEMNMPATLFHYCELEHCCIENKEPPKEEDNK